MNLIRQWFHRTFSDPQVVILLLALLGSVLAVILFADMLTPAIAAVVVAFLLDAPVTWLCRQGMPRMLAVSLVVLLFVLLVGLLMVTVAPPLVRQIGQFVNDAPSMIGGLRDALMQLQQKVPDLISQEQVRGWLSGLGNDVANLGPQLLQYSLSGIRGAVTLVVYLVLVPVMVFFFLKDKKLLLGWFGGMLPREKPMLETVWVESVQRAGDYARGKVYEIIIVGVAAFVTFEILGLRYATLLAVATGLSVIIPYIGAATVTLPVALVAYFQWGFSSDMIVVVVAYLILQALDGNLLAPLLFSEVVQLHPNAIIIAVLVFGGIWGFWGVFFAIPLATVANAVIRAWQARETAMPPPSQGRAETGQGDTA
ncbi:AI-2E family transporter [Yunchengibacter salinarum]|uniref:AI-2E family transporter n=1 Tax=Yunchengibacter salinarum TaxID=3133399 RepID=UPI0035B5FA56